MDRRNLIKIMAAGSGIVLVPGIFSGCDAPQFTALEGWRGPANTERDIRIVLLSYALLAPNPHNKQPWIIDLKDADSFDLYVDSNRLLPETDPPYRQIHISNGTFLENLSLAAGHYGYRTDIDYFPRGMYENNVLEKKPVAAIKLTKTELPQHDLLFDHILKRQSNRRIFTSNPLSTMQIERVRAAIPSNSNDYWLTVTADPVQRKKLSDFATDAMKIEVADEDRIKESVAMFRFNDHELDLHRDGFGAPQMGATGPKKFLIEHLLISRESFLAKGSSFGSQSVKGTRELADSAAAFGWLTTKNNTRLDQILIGRIYNRINLTCTSLDIAIHPMSTILQEYSDNVELQKEFKKYLKVPDSYTVQMFFRLGIAPPTRHTARRRVSDLFSSP